MVGINFKEESNLAILSESISALKEKKPVATIQEVKEDEEEKKQQSEGQSEDEDKLTF